MKRWMCFGAAAFLVLTLCAGFGKVLTTYYQPIEDTTYNLSLGWEGGGHAGRLGL